MEFASWLSPEFKLYLITEFQKLKKSESYNNRIDWHVNRTLAKIGYEIQTESIKSNLIPTLTEEQKKRVYKEEAELLNVALFGMTSFEWKKANPNLAKKSNIRDYADLVYLIILNNLENINSELIMIGMSQYDRLVRLNNIAGQQLKIIKDKKIYKESFENKKETIKSLQ